MFTVHIEIFTRIVDAKYYLFKSGLQSILNILARAHVYKVQRGGMAHAGGGT